MTSRADSATIRGMRSILPYLTTLLLSTAAGAQPSFMSILPPGQDGFLHAHEIQDELYFVHSGTALFEVDGEERTLGPGGLCHVSSTTPRKVSNVGDDDLVLLVIGGKDGYVERDGKLVDPGDAERRAAFGKG